MPRRNIYLFAHEDGTKDLRLKPGPQEVPIEEIRQRISADTRRLSAPHVVSLAESIAILGLLEPIVLDRTGHLLAGAHRYAALQLLAWDDDDRRRDEFDRRIDMKEFAQETAKAGGTKLCKALSDRVYNLYAHRSQPRPMRMAPVLVVDVTGKESDEKMRLAVEVAENSVRRPYTADEIARLAMRLKDAGYTLHKKGKPKLGEIPAISVLEAAVGRSKRTIERILSGKEPNSKSQWQNARNGFKRAALNILRTGTRQKGKDSAMLQDLAERSLAILDRMKDLDESE